MDASALEEFVRSPLLSPAAAWVVSPVFWSRLPNSTADGQSGRAIRYSRRVLGHEGSAAAAWKLRIRRLAILLWLGCRDSVVFSEAVVVSAETRYYYRRRRRENRKILVLSSATIFRCFLSWARNCQHVGHVASGPEGALVGDWCDTLIDDWRFSTNRQAGNNAVDTHCFKYIYILVW